ncbi:hypothetical protein [Marinitoga aeolica]|uniref:HTH LytTR-type domain-containing protein n=1 Tax=Marinitoga aeolica TaxID=2809031 RepID=A0ABY8PPX1_9BACT|nr:hypothetical protein [Marinitoga aeolica]WGS64660.1 hypothetical protein JRV97_09880 [Marinitoga aeolica]
MITKRIIEKLNYTNISFAKIKLINENKIQEITIKHDGIIEEYSRKQLSRLNEMIQ